MILLSTTRQRIARLPVLLRAHDCVDETGFYALSFGRRAYLIPTRAGAAELVDQAGRSLRAASGMLRRAAQWNGTARVPALVLERAGAGAWTYSEDISNAAFTKSGATVSGPVAGPDGRLTAYRLVENVGTSAHYMTRGATVTAGTRQAMVAVIRPSGRPLIKLYIADSATQANSVQARLNLATGVFSSITNLGTGSGAKAHAQPLGNGYWEIRVDGIAASAATTLTAYIIMTENGSTDSYTGDGASGIDVAHWGFEIGREVATSRMPGAAVAGSRIADSCYLPLNLVPQALSGYVRGIELLRPDAAAPADSALFYVGAAGGSGAGRLALYRTTAEAGYRALHESAAGASVATAVGAAAVYGDVIEGRLNLSAAGAVSHGVSINGGAEATSAPGTARALDAAFGAKRLYLNSFGSGSDGAFAFTHLAFGAPVDMTRDELRDLCEVG